MPIDYSMLSPQTIISLFPVQVAHFKDTGELKEELYDALYEHYVNSGEMPYGTAKARTGDPDVWIADRLDDLLVS